VIPSTVQILGSSCFSYCESLSSISFESNSQLIRIESFAFSGSSLESIVIPSTVQILGSSCFSSCKSFSSISFESSSRLIRIESQAFYDLDIVVVIPSTITFIACDAFQNASQICIADCDFCDEFDRWRELKSFGVAVDFRRILRFGYGLGELKDYEIDVKIFETVSVLDVFNRHLSAKYLRCEDDLGLVVKSIPRWNSMEDCGIKPELELDKLLNLCHPCIAAPIGFVLPDELSKSRELKIVGLYVEGISLSEVISMNPVWWTATAKAKTVVGIVLGLRFAHSLGLIHGHLNSRNIFFDSDDRIEITDFGVIGEEIEDNENENESDGDVSVNVNVGAGGFSSAGWFPKIDIEGFVSILIEILVGHPATQSDVSNSQLILPPDVPMFVLEMISANQSPDVGISESFNNIFDHLKENNFQILSGVDSAEVLNFVRWIEWLE
jgi:hypothetical protein